MNHCLLDSMMLMLRPFFLLLLTTNHSFPFNHDGNVTRITDPRRVNLAGRTQDLAPTAPDRGGKEGVCAKVGCRQGWRSE